MTATKAVVEFQKSTKRSECDYVSIDDNDLGTMTKFESPLQKKQRVQKDAESPGGKESSSSASNRRDGCAKHDGKQCNSTKPKDPEE